jgi:hypothetical protein
MPCVFSDPDVKSALALLKGKPPEKHIIGK